ncbi:hypothetical protein [Brevundimonas lenta]|uniref:Uncharacterized protein n=1 Tax=Brevundimonas lenta TaxID=424796 RepID=A0A7W6JEB1_9CAUL|nr:hypothetical protein [Brevundimonas lenta]MBB4083549.1 hypothetical protein [Brevundimonas lenta]
MTAAKGTGSFFVGFGRAAMGLGALLVVAWAALWLVQAVGGPDWRMPMKLLQSGGALIIIGLVLTLLVQARGASEPSSKDPG